ncbi:hypothetical protein DPMN_106662 [Dreissena polymorpha]|uniref:Uncharacterized protein n=1 Tax=Dreissena polymorpha TaxID=45954 RepID=A0A9D4QK04_DREPO|nr:hypothetical protein DPMN_106649 [Dreissena polymorpha]KAH3833355.1 hypothetical protein DPMN_106662 [Dreissena polymorpha]
MASLDSETGGIVQTWPALIVSQVAMCRYGQPDSESGGNVQTWPALIVSQVVLCRRGQH